MLATKAFQHDGQKLRKSVGVSAPSAQEPNESSIFVCECNGFPDSALGNHCPKQWHLLTQMKVCPLTPTLLWGSTQGSHEKCCFSHTRAVLPVPGFW